MGIGRNGGIKKIIHFQEQKLEIKKSIGIKRHRQVLKYTQEEVSQAFSEAKCILLDIYKDAKLPMRYICSCGNESTTCFYRFKSEGRCKKCTNKDSPSIKDVKNLFAKYGCTVLDTSYKNRSTPIQFLCSCGKIDKKRWSSARISKIIRCKKCAGNQRYTQLEVEAIFSSHGCKLISCYKDCCEKLDYICACGKPSKCNLNAFLIGYRRCKECFIKNITGEKNHRWNLDREQVKSRNKISRRCSTILRNCLKRLGKTKDDRTHNLLGYTRKQLYSHLILFNDWDKIKTQKWHIDHIFPVRAFMEHNIVDLKVINALDNLQPLLEGDNMSKGSKYDKSKFYQYLMKKYGEEKCQIWGIALMTEGNE